MIEKIVLDYLNAALDVPTYTQTPQAPPKEYVLLEKTGGGEANQLERATLAIQSVSAQSLYRAAQINGEVKEAMREITRLPQIFRARRNTDYNFTNPQTKQYRYQAVYDVTYKEV